MMQLIFLKQLGCVIIETPMGNSNGTFMNPNDQRQLVVLGGFYVA